MFKIEDLKFIDVVNEEAVSPCIFNKNYYVLEEDFENKQILVCKENELYLGLAITKYFDRKIDYCDFLDNCTACGGDWVQMFFTGIRRLFPDVWEAIPNDKVFDIDEMIKLLEFCGVVVFN